MLINVSEFCHYYSDNPEAWHKILKCFPKIRGEKRHKRFGSFFVKCVLGCFNSDFPLTGLVILNVPCNISVPPFPVTATLYIA